MNAINVIIINDLVKETFEQFVYAQLPYTCQGKTGAVCLQGGLAIASRTNWNCVTTHSCDALVKKRFGIAHLSTAMMNLPGIDWSSISMHSNGDLVKERLEQYIYTQWWWSGQGNIGTVYLHAVKIGTVYLCTVMVIWSRKYWNSISTHSDGDIIKERLDKNIIIRTVMRSSRKDWNSISTHGSDDLVKERLQQ